MSKSTDTNKATTPAITDANVTTVTLETPIMRGTDEIGSIDIRKPKTGALRGLNLADLLKIDVDSVIKLVPRISSPNLAEHEVANLDPDDFVQVSTAVMGFFVPKSQQDEIKDKM